MLSEINDALGRLYIKVSCWAAAFREDESGDVNIVSMVVLIGIAVALAVIFRNNVKNLLQTLFSKINSNASNAVAS